MYPTASAHKTRTGTPYDDIVADYKRSTTNETRPSFDHMVVANNVVCDMIRQVATDISNISEGNIVEKLLRHVLTKLMLHKFAKERTERHLEHRRPTEKEEKEPTRRMLKRRLKERRRRLCRQLPKIQAKIVHEVDGAKQECGQKQEAKIVEKIKATYDELN
jgi:hypothetical protein